MLKDHIIVVTGSSSGIGRSCVEKIIDNNGFAVGFDIQEVLHSMNITCTILSTSGMKPG